MPIDVLIDKVDSFEAIRDQIAAILVAEVAAQQALAVAGSKDPDLWTLRVFLERHDPWNEFLHMPEQAKGYPIVNIAVDTTNFDESTSNVVERQRATCTYHIDCYGYGISADDGGTGHIAGDKVAAFEAQRAIRLVRNILMASTYTYLSLRGLVWKRFVRSVRMFQPSLDERSAQKIVAGRIAFAVDYNEFSPQYTPETLEFLSATIKRAETGEVYLTADYDYLAIP